MFKYKKMLKWFFTIFVVAYANFFVNEAAAVPLPKAIIDPSTFSPVLGKQVIGEDVTFTVKFGNGGTVGFAPFMQIAINAAGADNNTLTKPCDGLIFKNAEITGVAGGPLSLNPSATTEVCPYGAITTQPPDAPNVINKPVGWQVQHINLPFGSFEPSQQPVPVSVKTKIHPYADHDVPLQVCTRGGFLYTTATGGPPIYEAAHPQTQIASSWNCKIILPKVMTISKSKIPVVENEAATGPSFQNFYPLNYDITVNLADMTGITPDPNGNVKNLVITDTLPLGMVMDPLTLKVFWQGTTLSTQVANLAACSSTLTIPPGPPEYAVLSTSSTLVVKFCQPLSGTAALDDVKISFQYYIKDVHNTNCIPNAVNLINQVRATADWRPTDPRDTLETLSPSYAMAQHILTAKCLAVQKSVTGRAIPGGVLTYQIDFQLSDYRTIGDIVLSDNLSNGQTYIPGSATLTIKDQTGSIPLTNFSAANVIASPYLSGAIACSPNTGLIGVHPLQFLVSNQMGASGSSSPTLASGFMIGGWAWGSNTMTSAIGKITFQAKIDDAYLGSFFPPVKKFIDKHDPLCNGVTLRASVYQNVINPAIPVGPPLFVPTSFFLSDNSGTNISVPGGLFQKSVYSVIDPSGPTERCGPNSTPCVSPADVHPLDKVTFRLEYDSIPSGDAENMTIKDWLPQPAFVVSTMSNFLIHSNTSPPVNQTYTTTSDNLTASGGLAVIPGIFPSTSTNSIAFNYGTFTDTSNTARKLDRLFTLKVTANPFVDGLLQTNDAVECESNTFNISFCQRAVAQIKLREPKLRINKGVIATSNSHGVFTSTQLPTGVTLAPPSGASPRLSGAVISDTLIGGANWANSFNSNLGSVDANDTVTFAIAIENIGGHPAYQVKVDDIITWIAGSNPCFKSFGSFINSTNFAIQDGAGNALPFSFTSSGGTGTFTLTNPIPALDTTTQSNGNNIVVIVFDVRLKANVKPGCCDNIAAIKSYTNIASGGVNFVGSVAVPTPPQDAASVCIGPKAFAKCIVDTSVNPSTSSAPTMPNTALTSGTVDGTIGEIVRYRLYATVPEGGPMPFTITDNLPVGMSYVPGSAKYFGVANSPPSLVGVPSTLNGNELSPFIQKCAAPLGNFTPSPILTSNITGGSGSGSPVTFNLGPITNTNNDNDLEFVAVEFNARVDNIASNQGGASETSTLLPNQFKVCAGPPNTCSNSPPVTVKVVEPTIKIEKNVVAPVPLFIGAIASYTLTLTNTGQATAYNVVLRDLMPSCPTSIFQNITVSVPSTIVGSATSNIGITIAQIAVGATVSIRYDVRLGCAQCSQLNNSAQVVWSSLPGSPGPMLAPGSVPGSSGSPTGERDGSGTYNDYAAQVSIPLCHTGEICVSKFEDQNGNGIQDAGEPTLPNWQFTVNPGAQTITTGPNGQQACATVLFPGNYSVTEIPQAGWIPTSPASGVVSGIAGSSLLKFGNRRVDAGCNLAVKKTWVATPLGQQNVVYYWGIEVNNVGSSPCTGITTIDDDLPPGGTVIGSGASAGVSCTLVATLLSCTTANPIPAGGNLWIAIQMDPLTIPFTNCVKINNPNDHDLTNNSACASNAPPPH